jgi:Cyclic nucleotide-binding domain
MLHHDLGELGNELPCPRPIFPETQKKDRSGAWSDAPLLPSGHTKRGVQARASGPTAAACERATPFQPKLFGIGKTILQCRKNQILFRQGDPADAVFYIQGRVGLEVVSPQGQQAVTAILEPGFFVGDACLAGELVRRATAISLRCIHNHAYRQDWYDPSASRRTLVLRAVHVPSPNSHRTHPRGLGRSTL